MDLGVRSAYTNNQAPKVEAITKSNKPEQLLRSMIEFAKGQIEARGTKGKIRVATVERYGVKKSEVGRYIRLALDELC